MNQTRHGGDWLALGGGIAIAVGALLPWATIGPLSVVGTQATSGQVTLVLGVAATLLALLGTTPGRGFAFLASSAAGYLMVREYLSLTNVPDEELWGLLTLIVTPGIGLYLGIIGAVASVAGCLGAMSRTPPAPR